MSDDIEEVKDAVLLLKVVEVDGYPNAYWILDESNVIRKILRDDDGI